MANVLVVDDEPVVRSHHARLLRDAGHAVTTAENGVEALAMLAGEPLPDAIVLDLSMPYMDGFAFRAAQTRDPRIARIPVVVASWAPARRGWCLEGTIVLRKPCTAEVLVEAVARAMSATPACASRSSCCDGCLLADELDDREPLSA